MHFSKFVEFWIVVVGLIELGLFPHSVDKLFKEREMLFTQVEQMVLISCQKEAADILLGASQSAGEDL